MPKNEYLASEFRQCVCLSPGECGIPASTPIDQCSQLDSYSCKAHKTGKIISLHKLDNPSTPLKTVSSDGLKFLPQSL